MNTNTPTTTEQTNEKDLQRRVMKRMLQVVIQMLIIFAALLISSGCLKWVWLWAYMGVSLGILGINSLILPPELAAERGEPRESTRRWDSVLATIMILITLGLLIVIGLDERFGWSPELTPVVHIIGLVLFALGNGLVTWAMASNKFFSTAVRIQMEREHTVATGGPYRYVRHPGYVGFIIYLFSTALALGSLWALILAGLTTCLFVVRTALEDKTLLEELDGYQEYAQQTRYRLLPGVW